ncbi:MAG: MFS transporter, partial [Sphingomonadales bacterium]|nr:MFS transporter [Sphingomonadales bacterium]
YVPMLVVLFLWRRTIMPSRLPPEGTMRAIVSGTRYILHSPPLRVILLRVLALGVAGGSITALMPLVASSQLHGDASAYGLLLGALGVGSVIGALTVGRMARRLGEEGSATLCALVLAVCLGVVAFSHSLVLSLAALLVGGVFWTSSITLFNIGIQMSAPRWVAGRALAAFQTAIAGGIALGSWVWGVVAQDWSVHAAVAVSALTIAATALLRFGLRLPEAESRDLDKARLGEFEVGLNLSGRSGPVAIEIEYHVDPDEARAFYRVMQAVQQIRSRNGAYDWTIARDIADPREWVERFHCPTWHDYLRMRDRLTREEQVTTEEAMAFHRGVSGPRVRRRLERPYGSVRWRDETRDEGLHEALPVPISLS